MMSTSHSSRNNTANGSNASLRCRGWCFTVNNPTPVDQDMLQVLGEDPRTVWLIYGVEKGASGTLHLQGYVYLKNAVGLGHMKAIHSGAHWETARGDFTAQRDYCSKGNQPKEEWDEFRKLGPNYGLDADVHEWGEKPRDPQEQRIEASAKGGEANKRKYEDTFAKAKEGKFEDISKDHLLKHYTTIKHISMDFGPRKSNLNGVCGVWLYGRPGTGKSRFAREKFGDEEGLLYFKDQNKWWDGYSPSMPYVLIEDPTPSHPNIPSLAEHLKIWTDRYVFPAQSKGGYMKIRPKYIVVTSNYTVDALFESLKDQSLRWALSRRFMTVNFDHLFNVCNVPPLFNVPPGDLPYTFDPYCFATINEAMDLELDHERKVGEDVDIDLIDSNVSHSHSVVETLSQDSSHGVAMSGSPSVTSLSSRPCTVRPVTTSLTIGSSSLHRTTAISPLIARSACTERILHSTEQVLAGAKTSSKTSATTCEKRKQPLGGRMSTLSRWNGLMAAAGLSQESIVTAGTASSSSARPSSTTLTRHRASCENSDSEGDACEDMDLNHSAGDYDLEDNFIASDDEFLNVRVKASTKGFLDSSSEESDSECD